MMADTQEQKLKGLRVVKAVFDTDPNGTKAYEARYQGSRPNKTTKYSYLTDQDFKDGDFAVVETPHGGLTVVRIVEVGPELLFGELPGHKWVISKVDYAAHLERAEREKRKKFLMDSLSARAADIKARLKLEEVLADDPAAKEMLEELKKLS